MVFPFGPRPKGSLSDSPQGISQDPEGDIAGVRGGRDHDTTKAWRNGLHPPNGIGPVDLLTGKRAASRSHGQAPLARVRNIFGRHLHWSICRKCPADCFCPVFLDQRKAVQRGCSKRSSKVLAEFGQFQSSFRKKQLELRSQMRVA